MATPRTLLVTGASDGIGFETARTLLALGHTVLVHGRHEQRAREAVARLGSAATQALPVWGDFSRCAEVVALARQVSALTPRLDVLINNAGIYTAQRSSSADGFELTMGINHFAPFLLTHHLLPTLLATPGARIVNVSSMTHEGAELDVKDLDIKHHWSDLETRQPAVHPRARRTSCRADRQRPAPRRDWHQTVEERLSYAGRLLCGWRTYLGISRNLAQCGASERRLF